ncbi:MAG: single-stranded DNA-binding protein [Devosia sp.]|nr:single-stranded DNA-binding protein [Devosia sp.]
MAGSVSKTILVGNVGKDPEIRNSGAGKGIATFSLATSDSWKDKNSGERKERTEWHRVVVFDESVVKFCEHHVKKGMKVYVEGKNRTRKWQKDGVDMFTTEVVVEAFGGTVQALESIGSGGPPPVEGEDAYGTTSSRPGKGAGAPAPASMDDDIPFAPEMRG